MTRWYPRGEDSVTALDQPVLTWVLGVGEHHHRVSITGKGYNQDGRPKRGVSPKSKDLRIKSMGARYDILDIKPEFLPPAEGGVVE